MADEEKPLIACIFHPKSFAPQTYKVVDRVSKNIFEYGLCNMCAAKLRLDWFKKEINDRLTMHVKKMEEQTKNNLQTKEIKRLTIERDKGAKNG